MPTYCENCGEEKFITNKDTEYCTFCDPQEFPMIGLEKEIVPKVTFNLPVLAEEDE